MTWPLCCLCPTVSFPSHPQADQLKARLQEMEEQLQKPGCDTRLGQSPMLGDAPRGDALPSAHLLHGMGDTPSLHHVGSPTSPLWGHPASVG